MEHNEHHDSTDKAGTPKNFNGLVDLHNQTRVLSDGSRISSSSESDELLAYSFKDSRTLLEAVRRGMRVSDNGPMLGFREKQQDGTEPYKWLTYKQVLDRSLDIAYGINQIGIAPGQKSFVGIYSRNRPEWIISELAAYHMNAISVPLYDTLGKEALNFIINQTELQLVICEDEAKALSLLECKKNCESLKYLVVINSFSSTLKEKGNSSSISVFGFNEIEQMGHLLQNKPKFEAPQPSDICTICYTSGTTGTPKGAMLTHGNVIASTTNFHFMKVLVPEKWDVSISYLPLAHVYEHMVEYALYQTGIKVGFYRGNIKKLADDIKELRPTIVPLVPRLLNRIYEKVMGEVQKSLIKKTLFNIAIAHKTHQLRHGVMQNRSIADKHIFHKIREQMGGRVRLMMTGSAPLDPDILTFARAAFGCFIIEGYGQTECSGACTSGVEADFSTGHVGIPYPCCKIKLVDAPAFNYFAKDQAGEICVKGYNVFKGYYKNEAITREALDEDGWLHTGDIGRWNPSGTLKIIDRMKNIFKLQQGEYIAPEKIENAYAHAELVAQSFVYGESLKTCLIGVVVPDEEALMKAAADKLNLKNLTFEEACANALVKKLILDDMTETGKSAGLHSFEQVKDIFVSSERFTIENGLLTPTLKNKRPQITKHYQEQLSDMYSRLS